MEGLAGWHHSVSHQLNLDSFQFLSPHHYYLLPPFCHSVPLLHEVPGDFLLTLHPLLGCLVVEHLGLKLLAWFDVDAHG